MIDAWDVYWVMQLDSIGTLLLMLAIISIVAGILVSAISACIVYFDENDAFRPGLRFGARCLTAGIVVAMVNAVLPSSKTAAAMIVLPALTSDQVVEPLTAEARELYGLAKQALTNLSEQPKPEPKAEAQQ